MRLLRFTREGGVASGHESDPTSEARRQMVAEQIAARGVRDTRVLEAMRTVPRHRFVPDHLIREAYADYPLPIGQGQTISQPYIVGYMTEAIRPRPGARVLDVGTGCGYQAAVLAAAGCQVFSIEIRPGLADEARRILDELGYGGVATCCGDGARGWPEEAPFDGIIVAAAAREVPGALLDQLAVDGRLVVPIGSEDQELWLYQRTLGGFRGEHLLPVRFVPLVESID